MERMVVALLAALGLLGAARAGLAATAPVGVNYHSFNSDPIPREVDRRLVELFQQRHPNVDVRHWLVAREEFKRRIEGWLERRPPQVGPEVPGFPDWSGQLQPPAPDVLTWFAGNRTRHFARKGLLADVTDVWERNGWERVFPAPFQRLSRHEGRYAFLPVSYSWWAVYYRKDVFRRLGVGVPATWDQFLGVCAKLREAGYAPIAIGTYVPWPAAGWFDYLDLRLNGPEFHVRLMEGEERYDDPRVRRVFEHWKQLLDRGCFVESPTSYTWQQATNLLVDGKAAMYLMGHFLTDFYPDERERAELDFFRFPVIDPAVPIGEEVPVNGYLVAARADNLETAKLFLSFLGSREAQELIARDMKRIVPRADVDPSIYPPDIRKGIGEIIGRASHLTQFYDRDTAPEMVEPGLNAMVAFMSEPGRIDEILAWLEQTRRRVFAK